MRLVLILIASATLGVGCAFPRGRSEPATFFTLTPLETLDGAAGEPTKEVLGLGPVAIPGYLDRPQLVTRVGANEVQLAAVARWGEPIREGIVRVLRQNLMAASAARAVIVYPWTSAAPVDLAVAVDVLRFEPNGRGDAELVARWGLREVPRGRVLLVRESRIVEHAEDAGTGAAVAALSRALGALGREIAAAVREVEPHRAGAAGSGRH